MHLNHASFISRCVAFLIDAIILVIPFYAIKHFTGDANIFPSHLLPAFAKITVIVIQQSVIAVALYWVYFFLFENSKLQATPGKIALEIKIVNSAGARPSLSRVFLRSVIKAITAGLFNLLFALCLFTKRKQNIHDIAGGTYVVYKDPKKTADKSSKIVKPLVIISLALQMIYMIATFVFYKSLGGTWQELAESFALQIDSGKLKDTSSWKNIQLPKAKISLLSPADFKREEWKEKIYSGVAVSESLCYESTILSLYSISAQYITFSVDVSPEEVLGWAGEKVTYRAGTPVISEIEIDGMKALQAVSEKNSETYRIIVIPETSNSVWIVEGSDFKRSKVKEERILQKIIDSIKIEKPVHEQKQSGAEEKKPENLKYEWKQHDLSDINLKMTVPGEFIVREDGSYSSSVDSSRIIAGYYKNLSGEAKEKLINSVLSLARKPLTVTPPGIIENRSEIEVSGLKGTAIVLHFAEAKPRKDVNATIMILDKDEQSFYMIMVVSLEDKIGKKIVDRIVSSIEIAE